MKSIASSTLWQVASQAVMAVLSILAAKFVAIGLSKELAGYYNSAYGYLQVFAIIADFGLYAISVREVSKATEENRERVLGALFVLRIGILIIAMGSALSAVWLQPSWRGTPFPLGVTIASLVPIFTLLAGMIRTVFQIHYKMQFVFIAEVLQRVITTAGLGFFILMGVRLSTNVEVFDAFLWIGGIGAFTLFLISFLYAQKFMRIRLCFDGSLLKQLVILAAPYGIAYLFMALYRQLDVVFIALLRPDFAIQNAYYGFAGRVEDMAFLIPTFLLNSVLPALTVRLSNNEDTSSLLGKTFFLLLLSGSTFFLFSFLWARPFTLLFATPSYLSTAAHPGSDTAFMLMSIPMFLNGLVLYCFYLFLAVHAWRRLIVSFGFGVLLTIVFNLLWTPMFGFVGAASALIVVHVLLTIILVPQALRIRPMKLRLREIGQWILFTLLLAPILYFSAPYLTSASRTVLGGGIMIGVLVVLGLILKIHTSIQWREQEP